ncbi:MAG: hypothetical protein LIO92_12140 [Clostridiales bacterium]|nr:hypothetical protein [Clostridiales bacterium]
MVGEAGDYGNNWNACDSMLSASLDAQTDAVKIFSFVNEMTDSSFDKETFEQTAELKATLSRGNDLLEIDE